MVLARISCFNRLKPFRNKVLLVNTVHDDIELDILDNDPELCYNICSEMERVFHDVPKNFERIYNVPFNVPLLGEVSYGPNLADMKEFDIGKGKEQFERI